MKKIRKKLNENKKNTKINRIKKVLIDYLNMLKNPIYLLIILKRYIITFVLQLVYSYFKQYQEHVLYNVNQDFIINFYNISSFAPNAIGGFISGIAPKKLGGYGNKKSNYVVIFPEIITALIVGFLAFKKNFYAFNIILILFFCFVFLENPVIQGYLLKTITRSIKGIGKCFDKIVPKFLGKIPRPII